MWRLVVVVVLSASVGCVTARARSSAPVDWLGCEKLAVGSALRNVEALLFEPDAGLPPEPPAERERREGCAAALPSKPEWVLVSSPGSGGGLDLAGLRLMQAALTRGRGAAPPVGENYDSLGVVDGDTAHLVFSLAVPIDVAMPSPDARWVAMIHHLDTHYAGAMIPFYLEAVDVTVLDVKTLQPRALHVVPQEVAVQALAVWWEQGALFVLAREHRHVSQAEDARAVWRCAAPEFRCALVTGPKVPAGRYAEATAQGGAVVEPPPPSLAERATLDPRSVRVSPSGNRVAWVDEVLSDDPRQPVERTLKMRDADGAEATVVVGHGALRARWLDDERLAFDGDPLLTAAWSAVRVKPLEVTPDEVMARVDLSLASDAAERAEMLVDAQRELEVERQAEAELSTLERVGNVPRHTLQHERLWVWHVKTGEVTPWLSALTHARLEAQPRPPNIRSNGAKVDVPPLVK